MLSKRKYEKGIYNTQSKMNKDKRRHKFVTIGAILAALFGAASSNNNFLVIVWSA